MYEFLTGAGVWIAFVIFAGGLFVRVASLYGVSRQKDAVFYNHTNAFEAVKSIFYWLIPWGSIAARTQPVFSSMVYLFHVSLIIVPLFLSAHNVLLQEAFGVGLWSIPDSVADIMTALMLVAGVFLFIRRLVRPEVRILTEIRDYVLLVLTMLPFLTGLLASLNIGPYKTMVILHVLSGEILLILIPFTKLGHMILFFFTRAFIGFEMGGRRGARTW